MFRLRGGFSWLTANVRGRQDVKLFCHISVIELPGFSYKGSFSFPYRFLDGTQKTAFVWCSFTSYFLARSRKRRRTRWIMKENKCKFDCVEDEEDAEQTLKVTFTWKTVKRGHQEAKRDPNSLDFISVRNSCFFFFFFPLFVFMGLCKWKHTFTHVRWLLFGRHSTDRHEIKGKGWGVARSVESFS